MKISAGILVYRLNKSLPEFFLVHPGGPFWKNKDHGAWSIPKGELASGEDPLSAAKREFTEETGQDIEGNFLELGLVKQKGGKVILAWAVEANPDAELIVSNNVTLEWPYKSGRFQSFPEVDKAVWFDPETARIKINPAQVELINELIQHIPNATNL